MSSLVKILKCPLVFAGKKIGRYNPKLLLKIRYFLRFKKRLDFNNPRTLNEKILYQSLFMKDTLSLRTLLTDKWRVRQYLEERGFADILIPSFGVWDSIETIDLDMLPKQFVLKPNNGCGDLIIVKDKEQINKEVILHSLSKSFTSVYGELEGGIHYYGIKPVIFAEQLLVNDEHSLAFSASIVDYKIWCFNGKAHFIMTCANRKKKSVELKLYDTEWKELPHYMKYDNVHTNGVNIPKPKNLERMCEIAGALSQPFKVVRVDLYNFDGKIYFGEMTFTSLGGLMNYYTDEFQHLAGSMINL